MQLMTMRAGVLSTVATVTLGALVVLGSACTADGPSLWTSGAGGTGTTGTSGTGGETECAALQKCCAELQAMPSSIGASCNGTSVPDDEMLCQELLESFQSEMQCTDITVGGSSATDAGTTTTGGGGTTAAYACNLADFHQCTIFHNFDDSATRCEMLDGTPAGTTCPTTALVGCCKTPADPSSGEDIETCFYTDSMGVGPSAQNICSGTATYSATP